MKTTALLLVLLATVGSADAQSLSEQLHQLADQAAALEKARAALVVERDALIVSANQAKAQAAVAQAQAAVAQVAVAEFDAFCTTVLRTPVFTVTPGTRVAYLWCGNTAGTWIGLFPVGAPDASASGVSGVWAYADCTKTAPVVRRNGVCGLTVPLNAPTGQYEHRLYLGPPAGAPPLGRGQPFTVRP